jgi:prepilin-type N-terminal cleavage/methylation domain-containing protein
MHRSGFTLIEILVAIAIMTIIMGVVVFDHQRFSEQMRITNLSYQIALSIRETQAYGINVRGLGANPNQRFDIGYGIHFDIGNPNSYTTFSDIPDNIGYTNSKYDSDDSVVLYGEKNATYNLEKGNKIAEICIIETASTKTCAGESDLFSGIDIVFKRPNPDARFTILNAVGGGVSYTDIQKVQIKIESPSGICRMVEVNSAGQISNNTNCE